MPHPMMALVESFDENVPLRNMLRAVAREKNEWAGIPMPLSGERLVIEPTYPYAALSKMGKADPEPDPDVMAGWKVRNQFWSWHRRSWIVVMQAPDGRITYGLDRGVNHLDEEIQTLGASDAWGIEQEHNALNLLATMLRHRQFKQYLLTGMFCERSPRSDVHYLFRKLRPTIAMSSRGKKGNGMYVLAALCMHPIAYYEGSWAGAMCPTDDVIAHLALMRGDEHMFWRRANQHPAWVPQAGL